MVLWTVIVTIRSHMQGTRQPFHLGQPSNWSAQYNDSQPLKDKYAHRILELQFLCETQGNHSQYLGQLMMLYTKAIQFHQGIGSAKFKLYRRRMEMFLQRPRIDGILRGTDKKVANKQEETLKTLKNIALGRMQASIQATQLMQTTQNKHRINQKIIKNNIGNQLGDLDSRLQRRRSNSVRSTAGSNQDRNEDFLISHQADFHIDKQEEQRLISMLNDKFLEMEIDFTSDLKSLII